MKLTPFSLLIYLVALSYGPISSQPITAIEVDTAGIGLLIRSANTGIQIQHGKYGLIVNHAEIDGLKIEKSEGTGIQIDSTGVDGISLGKIGDDGIFIDSTGDIGMLILNTGVDGINLAQVGGSGVWVGRTGSPSELIFPASEFKNGFLVAGTENHGLFVGRADDDGIHVQSAGHNGIHVESATKFGIQASGLQAAGYFDGKVGIGTTTPLHSLTVKDPANALLGNFVDVSNLTLVLQKGSNTNNEGVGLGFQSSGNQRNIGAAIIHERIGNGSKGKLHFATKTTNVEEADIPIHMTIDDWGEIGIGTMDPQSPLHIGGGPNSAILLDNGGELKWKNTGGTLNPVLTLESDNNVYLDATSNSTSALVFRTGIPGIQRMRITENGDIGIANASPSATLDINGDIRWAPVTSYISISPYAFQPRSEIVEYSISGSRLQPNMLSPPFAVDYKFGSPVFLPHGSVVQELLIRYTDPTSNDNFILTLRRVATNSNDGDVMAEITSAGSSGNVITAMDSSIEHANVDNENWTYYVEVDFPYEQFVEYQLLTVRIKYTMDRPY